LPDNSLSQKKCMITQHLTSVRATLLSIEPMMYF
jgi:hypothetical protein